MHPEWATYVKTYINSAEAKKKKFVSKQEALRKDVECVFGMLVARFDHCEAGKLKTCGM